MVRRLVMVVVWGLIASASAPSVYGEEPVDVWIARLGDPDPRVREQAETTLWSMGDQARSAIREAVDNPAPEIASRARNLVFRMEMGLSPHTPDEILSLIQEYRSATSLERQRAARALVEHGTSGMRVLVALRRREHDPAAIRWLEHAFAARPHLAAVLLLADGQTAAARQCLTLSGDPSDQSLRDWAAILLLRGGLEEQITATRDEAAGSATIRPARRLVFLSRAAGNLLDAADAAQDAHDAELLDQILIESRDWQRLAIRARDRSQRLIETVGQAARYQRLSGQQADFEKTIAFLQAASDNDHSTDHSDFGWFACAKYLMLNDRVDAGVATLLSHLDYQDAYGFLMARLQWKQALAIYDDPKGLDVPSQIRLKARLIDAMRIAGQRKKAIDALNSLLQANAERNDVETYLLLAEAAVNLGMDDRANSILAQAAALPNIEAAEQLIPRAMADRLDGIDYKFWWRTLRSAHMTQPYEKTFESLRVLGSGVMPAKDVDAMISDATEQATRRTAAERQPAMLEIGRTLSALGRREEARTIFSASFAQTPAPGALRLLADCLGELKRYPEAAEAFGKLWEMDRSQIDVLALWGWAMIQAGQQERGRQAIELAHVLPLGDDAARTSLERILRSHGLTDDAQRERKLLMKLGEPMSWPVCDAHFNEGFQCRQANRHGQAAFHWQQWFCFNFKPRAFFPDQVDDARWPARLHRELALDMIARSPADALKEAQIAMSDMPGDVDTLIELTRAFDAAGHREQADALYLAARANLGGLCEQFPDSGFAHNQLAWVEVCCRRDLDDALKHASRAAEIEPSNTDNLDTLAQVHFERGQVAQAVAAMQRCVELQPTVVRHREQLARFKAGDQKKGQ